MVPTGVPLPQAAGDPILLSTRATIERSAVVAEDTSIDMLPVIDLAVVLGEKLGTELLFSPLVSQYDVVLESTAESDVVSIKLLT